MSKIVRVASGDFFLGDDCRNAYAADLQRLLDLIYAFRDPKEETTDQMKLDFLSSHTRWRAIEACQHRIDCLRRVHKIGIWRNTMIGFDTLVQVIADFFSGNYNSRGLERLDIMLMEVAVLDDAPPEFGPLDLEIKWFVADNPTVDDARLWVEEAPQIRAAFCLEVMRLKDFPYCKPSVVCFNKEARDLYAVDHLLKTFVGRLGIVTSRPFMIIEEEP